MHFSRCFPHAKHFQTVIIRAEVFSPEGRFEDGDVSEPDNMWHVIFKGLRFFHSSQKTYGNLSRETDKRKKDRYRKTERL